MYVALESNSNPWKGGMITVNHLFRVTDNELSNNKCSEGRIFN